MAVWHTGLGRDGPGMLLHDLRRGRPDTDAAIALLAQAAPDIAVLLDLDHDLDGRALAALSARLGQAGLDLPHALAPRPNTGLQAGFDLDRDGRLTEPEDALGWGRFSGAGGIAVLSRHPVTLALDHGALLWRDAAAGTLPRTGDTPYFTPEEEAILPLHAVSAFEAVVTPPDGPPLRLLAWHASPPAFDGAERRNRLRNAAQNGFWLARLDALAGEGPVILIGNSNLDPEDTAGEGAAMRALLDHPALQDPRPAAPHPGGGPDTATAWWPRGPGALRVTYLLPDARLAVRDTGLLWPVEGRHALVWADLAWPPP